MQIGMELSETGAGPLDSECSAFPTTAKDHYRSAETEWRLDSSSGPHPDYSLYTGLSSDGRPSRQRLPQESRLDLEIQTSSSRGRWSPRGGCGDLAPVAVVEVACRSPSLKPMRPFWTVPIPHQSVTNQEAVSSSSSGHDQVPRGMMRPASPGSEKCTHREKAANRFCGSEAPEGEDSALGMHDPTGRSEGRSELDEVEGLSKGVEIQRGESSPIVERNRPCSSMKIRSSSGNTPKRGRNLLCTNEVGPHSRHPGNCCAKSFEPLSKGSRFPTVSSTLFLFLTLSSPNISPPRLLFSVDEFPYSSEPSLPFSRVKRSKLSENEIIRGPKATSTD